MSEVTAKGENLYSKRRVNAMIFAVILSMAVQGFGLFKLIPMQDAIQSFFSVNEGAYGILTSAQNWLVIVCSVPLGYLTRKLSCKWGQSFGFLVCILGVFIQIVTGNYILFVIGRMIEGGGLGYIALTANSLILTLVPEGRRGFWSSMNIVAAVLPQVIITKGGTTLLVNAGLGFRHIFAILGSLYLVVMILWFFILPESVHIHGIADGTKPTKEQTRRVYKNVSGWLVAIAYIFFNAVSVGFTSYVIKVLSRKGLSMSQAADTYSYTTLIGIGAMIFFGWLADKLHTKRKIVIVSFLACAAAMVLLAVLPANLIFLYVILYGTLPRSIAGLTSASSADIAEVPSDIPIVNSLRNTVTQIGAVLITMVMGFLIQYVGYNFTIYLLAGASFLGAVCWFFARRIP